MLYKKWKVPSMEPDKVRSVMESAHTGKLLSEVLVARGYDDADKASTLLETTMALPDPSSLQDMDKAVKRLQYALENDEVMVIFGDYDVDGITATALLYTYLESVGAQVYYKLPNRSTDEYGLTPAIVEQVAERGIDLIITVDNGTSAVEAAQKAKELGVDIVMTDHHLPPDVLPEVSALVNPCRQDDESGCEKLSGVGVAFMLVAALEGCPADELLSLFGDLVAIGTVADVMKLTGINRTLVAAGLHTLQDTQRPGLAALIEACGWGDKPVTAENISYGIAPRLNAAGRMDDATDALQLLLVEDEEAAQQIVDGLLEQNTARQKAEQEIVSTIVEQIESDPELQRSRVLVVWGEGWHQGVIGIVSSRLVDRFAKPALVISFDGNDGRGSGRSLAGFSLHAAIASCEDILVRYGGHDLAAGLSIQKEHVEELRRRLNAWALEQYPVPVAPELSADAALQLDKLTLDEVRELDKMAPFGSGNPVPKFYAEGLQLEAVYAVSEGRHSRLRLKKGDSSLFAVLFGTGPDQLPYQVGDLVDALLVLSIYEGRYEPQISARVVELRPTGMGEAHIEQSALFESFSTGGHPSSDQKKLLAPSREDTAAVYRAIRGARKVSYQDLRPIFARLGEELTGRILTALAALEELGLIGRDTDCACYKILPVSEKRDLSSSALLGRLEV